MTKSFFLTGFYFLIFISGYMQQTGREMETYFYKTENNMMFYSDAGKKKLTQPMVLSNGMKVLPDGSYIRLNESRKSLKIGEFLDYNGRVHKTLADLQSQIEAHRMALKTECFRLCNGEVIHHKNGNPVKIIKEVKINHGITLFPNGIYTDSFGKKFRLREGYCMDRTGRVHKSLKEFHLDAEQRNKEGKY